MRQTARDILSRWTARRSGTIGNTSVRVNPDGTATFALHGNDIVRIEWAEDGSRRVEATLAGWETPTTRSRLNDILSGLFSWYSGPMPCFWQAKGEQFARDARGETFTPSPSGWHLVGFLPGKL